MSIPRIVEAQFIKSAQSIADSLPEDMSEVVFLGRSNVGKSSTLNGLTQRKNLAKSSATPGKTQLINFFETRYLYNDQSYPVRFVDLPGFGYAKVSKSLKEVWQKNLVEFIQHRVSIRLFIHLRDARHANQIYTQNNFACMNLLNAMYEFDDKYFYSSEFIINIKSRSHAHL